jgi:hypothetical protein
MTKPKPSVISGIYFFKPFGKTLFFAVTYQIGKIYTKLPQNIPNKGKIHQVDLRLPKWA